MKPQPAIVQSVFDYAIREINALESRIVATEDDADAMLWEQARQVVAQLEAGLSRRQLAAQWINARTGEPYSHLHVHRTARAVKRYLNVTVRPRFRDVYNEIANASSRVTYNTGCMEWYTPADVIEAARAVLGRIDLDPASCPKANAIVQADRFFTRDDDGLAHPWQGRVWMNPPYGMPLVEQFADKLAASVTAGDVPAAIVLVNNGTETSWFTTLAGLAGAMCFPRGRLPFWQCGVGDAVITATPLQGQAVIYIGPERTAFCERFAEFGFVLVRPNDELSGTMSRQIARTACAASIGALVKNSITSIDLSFLCATSPLTVSLSPM